MRRPRSLRLRLTLGTTALVLGVLTVVGLAVYYSTATRLSASLRGSLETATAQAMAGTNYQNGHLTLGPAPGEGIGAGDLPAPGLSLTVVAPDGAILRQSGPHRQAVPSRAALAAARRGHTTTEKRVDGHTGARLLLLNTPLREEGKTLAVYGVTLSREPMLTTLRQLRLTLWVLLPLAAAVTAQLSYLLIGRMLRPLAKVTQMAAEISSRDLSRRLGLPPGEDEVGRLAGTFDAMLERLEDSFRRERQFVADASHELRTPLASLRAIVGVTRGRPRSEAQYVQALDDVESEARRLGTLVEGLLELARGDVGRLSVSGTVDLSGLLSSVCDSLRLLASAKGLYLTAHVPVGLAVRGDEDALVRVFVNVVDNAIKYTAEGGVDVRAERLDGMVSVNVRDTGQGLSAPDAARVFDRFYRGDASRAAGGTGLGLSIARQIVQAHSGSIELAASTPGITCRIILPALTSPPAA